MLFELLLQLVNFLLALLNKHVKGEVLGHRCDLNVLQLLLQVFLQLCSCFLVTGGFRRYLFLLQVFVFFLLLYYLHLRLLLVQIELVFSLSQFVIEVELVLIVVLVNVLLGVLNEAVPQSHHELEHLL